ncbi:putative L-type lectin-domain containing receptor kinase S.7 [Triticum urartu]|uniref:Putative L-type lectin-domain containing receptor kinase S.7 n=1 Tax=Triticum urartu TaxID=4572 RepID=M7ZJH9_TRIUA|nr:putative L-type lectin-domain containing receptor kinase S.7 [Triticum urartu]
MGISVSCVLHHWAMDGGVAAGRVVAAAGHDRKWRKVAAAGGGRSRGGRIPAVATRVGGCRAAARSRPGETPHTNVFLWYKIVKGIGSALHYLHHECNPCILHRDIKPGNILLNEYFNAKLGDFGLSMIASKNRATVVTTAVGSVGYMDPHLMKDGAVEFSRKSDVYSFGIVLLKIACTQKSREEVWQMRGGSEQQVHVDGVVDERLRFFDRTEMERVVVLGLKCSHSAEAQRPSMEDAMKFLEDGQEFPATTQGDGSYGVPCIVNEEAPMMTHGDVSSYYP